MFERAIKNNYGKKNPNLLAMPVIITFGSIYKNNIRTSLRLLNTKQLSQVQMKQEARKYF